jgi:hypothetical protein
MTYSITSLYYVSPRTMDILSLCDITDGVGGSFIWEVGRDSVIAVMNGMPLTKNSLYIEK